MDSPIPKEEYVRQNNERLQPHGLRIVDRTWYALLIGLAVLGVVSLALIGVLAASGKFQSIVTQEVHPLFNATVQMTHEYRPTTSNQYDFDPEIHVHNNYSMPRIEVRCSCGNSS